MSFRTAEAKPTRPPHVVPILFCLLALQSLVLPSATSPAAEPTGDWPLFRGNPSSTGVAVGEWPAAPRLLWKYAPEKTHFETTPAIVDGVCYLGDFDGVLHAVDLATGHVLWTRKTGSLGFSASPAITEKRIYLGDIDGKFYCFDMQGELQWQFEAEAEIDSSANFYKDKVLFGSQDATLYCLRAATGAVVWKFKIEDQIRCCPTIAENRAFVAGCDGRLHIVDLDAGKEIGSVDIGAPTGVTPAVRGDFVYFGTEGGEIFSVNWREAKVAWQVDDPGHREFRSSPAVTEKLVVIGNRGKNVYGLDRATGAIQWTFAARRAVDSSPLIVGSQVIFGVTDGSLHALDLERGKENWQTETGGGFIGSPAFASGRLVIANDDGTVYCFGK